MRLKIYIFFFAILTLLLYNFLSYDSIFVETIYSEGLFLWIRKTHDFSLGKLPFPTIYVLVFVLLISAFAYLKNYFNNRKRYPFFFKGLGILLKDFVVLISLVLILFYWLWAFNYKRPSFEQRNLLQSSEITEDWIFNELSSVHDTLVNLYPHRTLDYNHHYIEQKVRKSLSNVLPQMGYEIAGNARVRQINPKGFLLIWSTAGVYLPFVSEGHIDAGLPVLTKPFTLAHEMSHGMGIGSESTCNFTALLACVNSIDAEIQYSGWIGYFRYVLSAARRTNADRYKEFYENTFDKNIIDDLNMIYEELQKYPDILPKLRYFLYDSYLKNHGVTEGMVSYSRVIHLAAAWKEKHGDYLL